MWKEKKNFIVQGNMFPYCAHDNKLLKSAEIWKVDLYLEQNERKAFSPSQRSEWIPFRARIKVFCPVTGLETISKY